MELYSNIVHLNKKELKMKTLTTLFFLILSFNGLTQTDTVVVSPWSKSGNIGLNVNQIALSNWSQGGDNSIAWTLFTNMALNYKAETWELKNSLKVAFGRTKLGSDDYRTNDNELYLESVLSYKVGWAVDPYFSNTVRTAIGKGYDYKTVPYIEIASLFDPGYITQSLGFTYNKISNFSTRLGIALQETFSDKYRAKYLKDTSKAMQLDTGIESVTEGNYAFEENLLLTSKLRLFSRFDSMDVWDVRWDNTITAKISKYVNVNLNVLLIYEKNQSLKTQLKEALQLGFTYNLF